MSADQLEFELFRLQRKLRRAHWLAGSALLVALAALGGVFTRPIAADAVPSPAAAQSAGARIPSRTPAEAPQPAAAANIQQLAARVAALESAPPPSEMHFQNDDYELSVSAKGLIFTQRGVPVITLEPSRPKLLLHSASRLAGAENMPRVALELSPSYVSLRDGSIDNVMLLRVDSGITHTHGRD